MPHEGATCKSMREEMGLSVREVARRADVSPSYLSLVENQKRTPTQRWLRPVKAVLAEEMIRRAGVAS